MVIKMSQILEKELEAHTEKTQEMFHTELEDLKNKQAAEQYSTWDEDSLEGINSRINEAEEWINELQDRMVGITVTEENIEKRMKRNEDSLTDLWDYNKHTNICITGVPGGGERKDLRKYLKR